jgi:uncharacterized repeat protein (TIGR03803 family)
MRPHPTLLFALAALCFFQINDVKASTIKTIYSFCKKADCADGNGPNGLISDAAGNLYGTTASGGTVGGGTVFELVRPADDEGKWRERILYSFCSSGGECDDGEVPASPLVIDNEGNLYGTADFGGKDGNGAIFKLSPTSHKAASWQIETLYSFCNTVPACGRHPQYGLAYRGQSGGAPYDGKSPLYGTSSGGDGGGDCVDGCGIVFQLTHKKKWKFETIYGFCRQVFNCPDGNEPAGPLLVDPSGNLIGTTASGGANGANAGTLFELQFVAKNWQEKILYSFCNDDCLDGASPESGVTIDATGTLFGTTAFDGTHGGGTFFKVIPGDPVQVVTLHQFCSKSDCADGGSTSNNGLAIDASGNVFGTTLNGGGNDIDQDQVGGGTVFGFSNHLSRAHAFCSKADCSDGEYPFGPIVVSSSGKIYGAAFEGGKNGGGLIFEVEP